MSYLTRYATRALGGVRLEPGVRVHEYTRLNLPGFYGDRFVRVFVEDTSRRNTRRGVPEPRLRLRIADCTNVINLEFSVESSADRKNSLFKIDTLLGALGRFRAGLRAEAELRAAPNASAERLLRAEAERFSGRAPGMRREVGEFEPRPER